MRNNLKLTFSNNVLCSAKFNGEVLVWSLGFNSTLHYLCFGFLARLDWVGSWKLITEKNTFDFFIIYCYVFQPNWSGIVTLFRCRLYITKRLQKLQKANGKTAWFWQNLQKRRMKIRELFNGFYYDWYVLPSDI